jgi:hypothetical protein
MTRVGAKATLLALSFAATLGGWAVLAGRERAAVLPHSAAIVTTALASRPDVGQQPAAIASPTSAPAAPALTPGAASNTSTSLRPLARTRSSR